MVIFDRLLISEDYRKEGEAELFGLSRGGDGVLQNNKMCKTVFGMVWCMAPQRPVWYGMVWYHSRIRKVAIKRHNSFYGPLGTKITAPPCFVISVAPSSTLFFF